MDYSKEKKGKVIGELLKLEEEINALSLSLEGVAGSDKTMILKQLQKNLERYKFAAGIASDGFWDWDITGNHSYYSPQLKTMLGFSESEILCSPGEWSKRIHPDDQERVLSGFERHLKGETKRYSSEHRIVCKDGKYKLILEEGCVVSRDKQGNPLRMIGTCRDISDGKKIVCNLNERIKEQSCNKQISEFLINPDLTNDEILRKIVEIIPDSLRFPNAAEASITINGNVFNTHAFKKTKHSHIEELKVSGKKIGQIEVCYLEKLPGCDQTFLPVEIELLQTMAVRISTFADRNLKALELAQSEKKYRTLIENINDVIYENNREGIITYITPSVKKLLGYTPEELIGKSFAGFVGENTGAFIDNLKALHEKNIIQNEYCIC